MSRVSIAVSVVVAAVLTVITAALYRQGPEPNQADADATRPLILFDAKQADLVRVTYPDGRVVSVRRAGESLDWWVAIDSDGVRRLWPASPASVRGALRLLDTARADPRADAPDSLSAAAATLRIDAGDERFEARIGERAFGGRALAEVEGEVVGVAAAVHDLAASPGPQVWRDPAAFPGLSGAGLSAVSRIHLRTPERALLLSRVEGRWWVYPEADLTKRALPADNEAVADLLSTVASTRVSRFIDESRPDEETGLDDPVAVLTLEDARRTPEGERRERIRELRVGLAADLGEQALFARLDDTDARAAAGDRPYEPQLLAIEAAPLAELSMRPEPYIAPVALRAAPTDVGRLTIRDYEGAELLSARRTIEGWRIGADGARVPTADERALIEQAIALLTTAAGEPALADDATYSPLATIAAHGLSDEPLGEFTLGVGPGADGADRPVLATDRVARTYEASAADAILGFVAR